MDHIMERMHLLFTLLVIGLCALALMACPFLTKGPQHYEQARQALLDQYHAEVESKGLGDEYILRPIPSFSAGATYNLGSVFIAEKFPLKYTTLCSAKDAPISMGDLPPIGNLDGRNSFNLTVGIPELLRKSIKEIADFRFTIKNDNLVQMSFESASVRSVAYRDLERKLQTVDCLADIANQDVLVVAGIFTFKQTYKAGKAVDQSSEGFKASIDVKLFSADDDSIVGSYETNGSFIVQDSKAMPRVWILVPFRFDIKHYDPDALFSERKRAAAAALRPEDTGSAVLASAPKIAPLYSSPEFLSEIGKLSP